MPDSASKRRFPWIVIPSVVLILLALGWSGFWYYAAGKSEEILDRLMAREAAAGRQYSCASRNVSGFPFRFELRCREPRLELAASPASIIMQARDAVALAQVWQPTHLILEVTGPATYSEAGAQPSAEARWKLLQASVRGTPGNPDRLSVVVDDVAIDRVAAPQNETIVRAGRLEIHARTSPESKPNDVVLDIATRAIGMSAPAIKVEALDADIEGTLRGLKDLRAKPIKARLQELQQAGGRLTINKARLQQGGAIGAGTGSLGLTPSARIEGSLRLTIAGFESVVKLLTSNERTQAGMLAGLSLLRGKNELEGKRAIDLPLRFVDGNAYLGPIPIGQVPALY